MMYRTPKAIALTRKVASNLRQTNSGSGTRGTRNSYRYALLDLYKTKGTYIFTGCSTCTGAKIRCLVKFSLSVVR
jgi:hypothetical protein